MGKFFDVLKWILIASVFAMGLWALYGMGIIHLPEVLEPAVEDRYAASEIECAALTMLTDTKAEPSPRSNVVDERVVRTILNYSKVYKTDLCKIFQKQLTLIPVGVLRSGVPDRRAWWVRTEFGQTTVDGAIVLVKRVIENPDSSWKATHYIRVPRSWTKGNQTEDEIAQIKATMVAVSKNPNDPHEGVIEFFEPKAQ